MSAPYDLTHRDWHVECDYGSPAWPMVWSAVHKEYDASWEGEEDGWVASHPCFRARTHRDLIEQIECWYLEQEDDA